MRKRNPFMPVVIILVVALTSAIVLLPEITLGSFTANLSLRQGLDLQGGLQVLLEADLPPGTTLSDEEMADSLNTARTIIENRVNALGVTEPKVQTVGQNRISVELPGVTDVEQAIATFKQTGLLEFVYSSTPVQEGTLIRTDCYDPTKVDCGGNTPPVITETVVPTLTPTAVVSAATDITSTTPITPVETPTGPLYDTVMTGAAIDTAAASLDQVGQAIVNFTLKPEGAQIFGDFTSQHVGEYLLIVLDKRVVSSPSINSGITGGQGQISGNFTADSANRLAIQLRYGSLPVPLRIAQSSEIGPTLGQDSIRKSITAGIIGVVVVILFMVLYYRLPGAIASVALLIYALITVALFETIPVVLTLPGIAGFVLSVGVAVDANILIFERLKEELRNGKQLRQAVDVGFRRAWPSIRDSNISTLITCAVLFVFGSTFGASIVQGFAVTLALGVFVSLFTAIVVTRTILHYVLDGMDLSTRHTWFGI